jgi:DNA-binding NarL/FixJ family response regulator
MHTVQLLIVHSQSIVVTGIETLVKRLAGWQIVGKTAHASAALQFVQHTPPHIVVVEQQLPGINGIALCALLHAHIPHVATAIVGDLPVAQQLLAASHGVGLFIPPAISARDMATLAAQLRHAQSHRTTFHSTHVVARWRSMLRHTPGAPTAHDAALLSERELHIISWVARGYSNRGIADLLGISPHTVKQHLDNIYAKCHVHNRAAVVAMALKWGWIEAV